MSASANVVTCGNCRFSVPATDGQGVESPTSRFCRRYPPRPVLVPHVVPAQEGQPPRQVLRMEFHGPVCDATFWCGEWQPYGAEAPLPGEIKPTKEAKRAKS